MLGRSVSPSNSLQYQVTVVISGTVSVVHSNVLKPNPEIYIIIFYSKVVVI